MPDTAKSAPVTPTTLALQEIFAERERQDRKWGQQDHPLCSYEENPEIYAGLAHVFKLRNDDRVSRGTLGFDSILLEEVYEALAETDPRKAQAEMIQVAAVATAIVERLQRMIDAPVIPVTSKLIEWTEGPDDRPVRCAATLVWNPELDVYEAFAQQDGMDVRFVMELQQVAS